MQAGAEAGPCTGVAQCVWSKPIESFWSSLNREFNDFSFRRRSVVVEAHFNGGQIAGRAKRKDAKAEVERKVLLRAFGTKLPKDGVAIAPLEKPAEPISDNRKILGIRIDLELAMLAPV